LKTTVTLFVFFRTSQHSPMQS